MRCPFPVVGPFPVFEPVWVLLSIPFSPIPPGLTVVWYDQCAVVCEWNGDFEAFGEGGDEGLFEVFGVLEGEGVVVVHVKGEAVVSVPDAQHSAVYYFGQ